MVAAIIWELSSEQLLFINVMFDLAKLRERD
jgi:hypothetical protein